MVVIEAAQTQTGKTPLDPASWKVLLSSFLSDDERMVAEAETVQRSTDGCLFSELDCVGNRYISPGMM